MRRIGVLGGTFDPIHIGHLLLGQWAMERYMLDEVWYIPAGAPYFKAERGVSSGADRLRMVELAVGGAMCACDMEIRREGRTYTYETVEELRAHYPDDAFYFIFGADCLDTMQYWREPRRILAGAEVIAATRGGTADLSVMQRKAEELMEELGGKISVMSFPAMEVSSTLIRERVAAGLPIRYLVPEAVERYIMERGLYVERGSAGSV